ncbi:MAG: hypothetical protein OEV93_03625, partial [Candidatus Moranbacteria bacterium]|nr:hypothetical protein [Candidatus Moranbacteria bacterium]
MGNFGNNNRGGGGYGGNRGGRGGFGGGQGGRKFGGDRRGGDRPEMHRAVCSKCGDNCEVPFKP